MAVTSSAALDRIIVLAAGVLLLLAPLIWMGWSVSAAFEAREAIRLRSETLATLRERLSAFAAGADAGALDDAASPYLPGATAAIAGAALQRIVADTVEEAGGRLAESEIARIDASEGDPGRVDLRVSFDSDIVGLQRILFKLETGAPIMILHSLNVRSADVVGEAGSQQPVLRVVLLVGGYWEA